MKKILIISPYPFGRAPSQRFRFEQYLVFLFENNFKIKHISFIDESTWSVLYKKGFFIQKIIGVFMGILRLHRLFFIVHKFDFIFIHREACLIGPAYFEYFFSKIFKKKIIYDFDDAIWLKDTSQANKYATWLKWPQKTKGIIKCATVVIVGNKYLYEYAKQYNPNVTIIPTTIDLSYHKGKKEINNNNIVIGWTGSISTNKHFDLVKEVLNQIHTTFTHVKFHIISNSPIFIEKLPLEFVYWSKEHEIDDLLQFDIGIMPLSNDEWSKGKCGFKALQYMALSIPTIVSPVGVNKEIIQDGINGFFATTKMEWVEKISNLINLPELREKIGNKGKETIEQNFSVEANKHKYLAVFQSLDT